MMSVGRRSPVITAACLGAAFAAVVILSYSGGHVSKMTSGDGLFFRYVAAHMDATKAELDPIVAKRGPSLRYGRIALPAMIWLLSGGRPGLMPYTQPFIMVASAGAIAAAAKRLNPDRSALIGLVPFLALGLTLSIAGGYAESVAVAFALWAIVAVRSERWFAAMLCLSIAMLARENAAVVLAGLGLVVAMRRLWRPLAILALSLIPVLAWHLIVAVRFGHLPLADPTYYAFSHPEPIPFLSVVKGLYHYSATATLTAAVHVVLWIVALALLAKRPRSDLAILAVAAGLQLAVVPLLNWQYAGDTFRLFSFLEVFTVLAVTSAMGTAAVSPSLAHPAGAD